MLKIFDLTAEDKLSREEIGAKAHGLMQAKRYGFSVPNGFVLPVSFFDSWFCIIHSSLEWEQYIKDPTPAVCSDLKEKVLELCFDPEQKCALDSYFKKSGFDGVLAVRSSSPGEDSEDISFAGMYHSCMDVEWKDLENAVALTLSSLFAYRVVAYKLKTGLDVTSSRMAVIVQRQLDSELSGVGFSINPENNCYDEIMINAIAGPGEALMSGALTPDCYIVEKFEGHLLRKNLADIHSESHRDDELILAVASLVRECEDTFEYPVDIEWSYEEGNLYLLQVRPITAFFPLFEEMLSQQGEPRTLYVDVMQTSQGLTRQISVLGLDLYDMVMQRIMAQGIMPSIDGGYILNLHGKQYFNVSNMLRGMGKSLTIQTAGDQDYAVRQHKEEISATYMAKGKTPAMKEARKAMIRVALRDIPKLAGAFLRPTHRLERYQLLTEQILIDIRELSGEECFSSTVKKGFSLLDPITEHAATYVPGQLALERIKRMFRGKDLEEDIAALGIALPSNPTTAMTRSLYALASNPEFAKVADECEFVRRIKTRNFDESFLLKIDEYLANYGGRGFNEIDVAIERAGDDYTLLFRQMGDISVGDNGLQRAEDKKKLAIEKLGQIAVSKGKGEAFRKNLERYEKLFGLRENPKYVVSMLLGRLHQLALVLGRRWVAEGRLDKENQVFDLHLGQIKRAEREPGLALRPMIQINMEPYLLMKNVKHWPITFDSRGRTINPVPEIAEGGMKGQTISLGVVRGRAKVLIDPYEKSLLSGEILVTHAMEPSWMVVLLNATGVVLEVGGNLQHGAIIAREFGIPCVSGLRRATTLIHDGDLVEVDGNNGLVRILEKSEIEND